MSIRSVNLYKYSLNWREKEDSQKVLLEEVGIGGEIVSQYHHLCSGWNIVNQRIRRFLFGLGVDDNFYSLESVKAD